MTYHSSSPNNLRKAIQIWRSENERCLLLSYCKVQVSLAPHYHCSRTIISSTLSTAMTNDVLAISRAVRSICSFASHLSPSICFPWLRQLKAYNNDGIRDSRADRYKCMKRDMPLCLHRFRSQLRSSIRPRQKPPKQVLPAIVYNF